MPDRSEPRLTAVMRDADMKTTANKYRSEPGPRQRRKHYSYNENVDEPAKLIADEPVEVERAVPADENEPVERVEDRDKPEPPVFEE
jgi:hypothetical protein